MLYHEVVKQETPRLVVLFKKEDDRGVFHWGVVGQIPILDLVGAIGYVQHELAYEVSPLQCPESALVIVWDDKHSPQWFVHPDIPVYSLIGMLETIKSTIVNTHMAKLAAQQKFILGPDGQPVRRL